MLIRVWVLEEDLFGLLCVFGLISGDGEAGVITCVVVVEFRYRRWVG